MASAGYNFTHPQLLVEFSPLFEGSNQYFRYEKLFMTLVKDNVYELKNMGVGDACIVTNSYRKGVATMVVAGCTVSTTIF